MGVSFSFFDMASAAKIAGLPEQTYRGLVLSGIVNAWVCLHNEQAHGRQDCFLPLRDPDLHVYTEWEDRGSRTDLDKKSTEAKPGNVDYVVSGWVILDGNVARELLTKGEVGLANQWIWVPEGETATHPLWLPHEYIGGYTGTRRVTRISPADMFFRPGAKAEPAVSHNPIPSKNLRADARQTYERIIAALWTKAHGDGGVGKLSSDPHTAAASLATVLAEHGLEKPEVDTIGRRLAEARRAGIRIGSSD